MEKKEGKLKKHEGVTVVDLPGIYSLSPYTLEEVVARNYLIDEKPDVILNIVDGSNLERNLYLTTQLMEAGLPVVVAINMMDVVKKSGDKIDTKVLSESLGCKVVEISALKNEGIMEAAEAAIEAAKAGKTVPHHPFSGAVEHAIAHIEEAAVHNLPENEQRWYAVKIFERDEKAREKLNLPQEVLDHVEKDIVAAEKEMDDDAESIITNERYLFVGEIIKGCYKKKNNRPRAHAPHLGSSHLRRDHVPRLFHLRHHRRRLGYGLDERRLVRRRLPPLRHRFFKIRRSFRRIRRSGRSVAGIHRFRER